MEYYAHSKEDVPPQEWQRLEDHLKNVAERAAEFARPFGGDEWAYIAGFWHDLGKYSEEFQRKLQGENIRVVHSEAGGHLSQQRMLRGLERVFCWLIMGHHAGLADYSSGDSGAKALEPKMRKPEKSNIILENVPDKIKNHPTPDFPQLLHDGADLSFLIRMLFSCVVDADFLDTEAFMDEGRKKVRSKVCPTFEELLASFDAHMDEMCKGVKPSKVNKVRAEVLAKCRNMAEREPSVFSLTVPTGGGKTLSSLDFALRHAIKHGKRRIIYVIPYTSIIEQTAEVFRNIPMFERAVLEHHSNVSIDDQSKRNRLAAENWDMPIIVTTAVQFFESLYANKTSRCRKLHNVADSVIIFDEAQCLPPDFLRPAVFAIRELHRYYGVTPVLCTATQPVLTRTESFDFKFEEGFESVVEIVENPDAFFDDLKRVEVKVFNDLNPVDYNSIAKSICSQKKSILCIVNRKNDARELTRLLSEEQTVHLSTNMCAEHRLQTLNTIKQRLKTGKEPLYVVSTSLVEAGVDLDFPVVYRALAGLDSIAQAAGRCNREGSLSAFGKTIIFVPEKQPHYVLSSASLARGYLQEEKLADIFLPTTFQNYFGQRFFQLGQNALDKEGILALLGNNSEFSFQTAAQKFRLINDDWTLPLIVPFGEAPKLVGDLLRWNVRSLFRKLQRYIVSIPKRTMNQLINEGHARELLPEYPGTYYLHNGGLYTSRFGFVSPDKIDAYDPEVNII